MKSKTLTHAVVPVRTSGSAGSLFRESTPAKHRTDPASENAGSKRRLGADFVPAPLASSVIQQVLQSPGEALSPPTRAWAEPLFGRDLSGVRVHTDAKAAESARRVNALAYTVGQNVVFNRGNYSPTTRSGQKLLVHELVHTVQQTDSAQTSTAQQKLEVSRPTDPAEREADVVAHQVQAGGPVRIMQRTARLIQRSIKEVAGGISIGLGAAAVIGGVAAIASGSTGWGALAAGLGLGAIGLGMRLRKKNLPPPTSIRVVQNHQVPLDSAGVARGFRSGFGGVSEIEVSNGNIDYDGAEIDEHFVGGHCENANRSGQGGTSGSTFTVGQGFTNRDVGTTINLHPKRNTFYDQHLVGIPHNVLPPGQNDIFSVCEQQYTFDGQIIAGKTFRRRYDIHRDQIDGQDVAIFRLSTSEQGPSSAPVQPAAPTPAPAPAQPASSPAAAQPGP
jgi:hypothetical protein